MLSLHGVNDMNILVFAPHPDDDLIGCGGSLIRHGQAGHHLTVAYMTSGEAGSLNYGKEELAELREQEARDATEILGIHDLIFLRNADGYLTYDRNNLIRLTDLIRERKPQVVYIPHARDGHKDHMITHDLAVEAVRRARGPWFQECTGQPWAVDTLLCYEVWTPLQEISYAEDITAVMPLKIKALRRHRSQLRDISYEEAVQCLNRYRGVTTGRGQYCECFQVLSVGNIVSSELTPALNQ
jgi:LmbE family N-acetylglucosaminyl deacetylase